MSDNLQILRSVEDANALPRKYAAVSAAVIEAAPAPLDVASAQCSPIRIIKVVICLRVFIKFAAYDYFSLTQPTIIEQGDVYI